MREIERERKSKNEPEIERIMKREKRKRIRKTDIKRETQKREDMTCGTGYDIQYNSFNGKSCSL